MKRLFATRPALGLYLAGSCAGVLALLSLVLATLVALALFNLLFTMVGDLAKARAADKDLFAEVGWDAMVAMLHVSLTNVANALWEVRWGLVVAGGLGLIATWGERIGGMVDPRWATRISFAALALTMMATTIVWIFAQWAQIAEGLAQAPELYYARDLFASSFAIDLTVGLLLGLLLALPSWTLWRHWYERLGSALAPAPSLVGVAEAPTSNYQTYAARIHALKRGDDSDVAGTQPAPMLPPTVSMRTLVVLTLILTLLVLASIWVIPAAYQRVAIRLTHESLYVRAATQPDVRVQLAIEPDAREIAIANLDGDGSVRLTLRGGSDCNRVIQQLEPWRFERKQGEYLHNAIPLTGMAPGDYCLDFHQDDGWGMYEYTLSHGGGQISHQLALATGLLAATTVVVAAGLTALTLLRLGIIAPNRRAGS